MSATQKSQSTDAWKRNKAGACPNAEHEFAGTTDPSNLTQSDSMYTTEWRAAQDPSRIWRATRRQATRIRARKSFCPQDEVPEARLQAQEREWKRLLARPFSKTSSNCSDPTTVTRSTAANSTAETSCAAGISSLDLVRRVRRDGCFMWRSQVLPGDVMSEADGPEDKGAEEKAQTPLDTLGRHADK